MSVGFIRPAVIDRRYRRDFEIQRLRLETPAVAFRTGGISPIPAEQHPHVHLVSLALGPAKESADAVPAIVLIVFVLDPIGAFLAVNDEILIGLRQFFERKIDIDLFARAGAEQTLLRFAELLAAKNTDNTFFDSETSVRQRLVQIERNGAAEA